MFLYQAKALEMYVLLLPFPVMVLGRPHARLNYLDPIVAIHSTCHRTHDLKFRELHDYNTIRDGI